MQHRRITLVAVGSRGDMQPYCALALGLQQAGYRVKVATNPNFAAFVSAQGLDFAPIAGDYKELLRSNEGQKLLSGQPSKIISDDLLLGQMTDAWHACRDAEVVIFMHLSLWSYSIVEKLGMPGFLAATVPISPTRTFPFLHPPQAAPNPITGALNYGSYFLIEFLSWQQSRVLINRFRRETLGLPPLPFLGNRFRKQLPPNLNPLPILYGFSPTILPKPPDWTEEMQVTGAWFLEQADVYQPPQALLDFIHAAAPPLCVGFGSMVPPASSELMTTVLAALEHTGQRGIILAGWAGMNAVTVPDALSDRIFVIEAVPHDWLFPQMAVVIHHGGAGTTAAACRAGIPSVIVSFFADQPFWGQRLAALGISPPPIRYPDLTVEALTAAIQTAATDEALRFCADEVGRQIRQEDGVTNAVAAIRGSLIKNF